MCYLNYCKYEYPSQKLDMNGLSSCIYDRETLEITMIPESGQAVNFKNGGGKNNCCTDLQLYQFFFTKVTQPCLVVKALHIYLFK